MQYLLVNRIFMDALHVMECIHKYLNINLEEVIMYNTNQFDKYQEQFKSIFNMELRPFINMFGFNIILFDEFLHKYGYTEAKHGSIRDYLKLKYPGAVQLISDMLDEKSIITK